MATLRGYTITEYNEYIRVQWGDRDTLTANKLPSPTEARAAIGLNIPVTYYDCFYKCNITAAPNIDVAEGGDGDLWGMFSSSKITEPPAIPSCTRLRGIFDLTLSLSHFPVIPLTAQNIQRAFASTYRVTKPVSVPGSVTNMKETFRSCSRVAGEMIIRPTSLTDYTDAFAATSQPITLYGDKTLCEALAATASNGNVTWSPWYDPVPSVTTRGEGSRTTAADLTRMVHNGALAVSSYAPGRMTYDVGDIVREDEWKALVNAAKTIDPTITYLSHFENMNKIEAAFDSAL